MKPILTLLAALVLASSALAAEPAMHGAATTSKTESKPETQAGTEAKPAGTGATHRKVVKHAKHAPAKPKDEKASETPKQ
jgi:hypothetical protein